MARYDEERGSHAVSSALLFPLALLMILAIFQGAVYMFGRTAAMHAANGGAQAAAVRGGDVDTAREAASGRLARTGPGALGSTAIQVSGDAATVSVTVTGTVDSLVPFIGPWPVSATATAPVERFTSPGAP